MLMPPHLEKTVNLAQRVDAAKAASPLTRFSYSIGLPATAGPTISPMQLIDGGIALTPAGNNWPSWIDHFPPDDLSVAAPLFQPFEVAIRQWFDSLPIMLGKYFTPLQTTHLGMKGAPASR